MGFVQASMLAALVAVALPVIAHLIFRRRSRPVELGTLRFLKLAVRRDTRRRWLKRWLLLALRVGCVALLVLLFARPYRAESLGGGDAGLTVILIDRSASMDRARDGERLVEHAMRKLPAVVARIPARSRVEVAWFDTKVDPVGTSADGRVSLADLKAPEALTGGPDAAARPGAVAGDGGRGRRRRAAARRRPARGRVRRRQAPRAAPGRGRPGRGGPGRGVLPGGGAAAGPAGRNCPRWPVPGDRVPV